MNRTRLARRAFLKSAGQTLLAAPALSMLAPLAEAQQPASATPHGKSTAHVSAKSPAKPTLSLNIRDLGATGDGTTKDTLPIQLTIERCSLLGGGEVVVPAGNYLTGALALRTNVTLRIEKDATLHGSPDLADYPLSEVRWEGRWIEGYIGFISATDATNIAILGPGRILGSDAIRGRVVPGKIIGTAPNGRPIRATGRRLPALIEFVNCKNVRVADLDTQQFGMWSIHPALCQNVTFHNVVIKSGADGIDVDSCQHVVIDGCDFSTGDDCISLKSGRGEEAFSQIGVNPQITCEDVHISNCTFADSNFACIGIGSETSGGIRGVRVENCTFTHARTHAVYIKSRPGRGAFVEDIVMNNLTVSGAQLGFLRLNNLNSGKSDEFNVPGLAGIPTFRNFTFSNVHVTGVPDLVRAVEIHPDKPLVGLTLANITGTCQKGIALANMHDVHLRNIHVTGFTGPLLSTHNVTGTGLQGAVPIPAADMPKLLEPVPTPATPYKLH